MPCLLRASSRFLVLNDYLGRLCCLHPGLHRPLKWIITAPRESFPSESAMANAIETAEVAATAAAPSIAESLAAAVMNALQRYLFFWLWLGLGILGEVFTWCGWKFPKFLQKNAAPVWVTLCKRKGPCRQACRWFKGPGFLTPARFVQPQRVPGVKGARGLCGSFRGSPLKSLTGNDRVTISVCKHYLLNRWPQGYPSGFHSFGVPGCGPRIRCTSTKEFTVHSDNRPSVSQAASQSKRPQWSQWLRGGMPMGAKVSKQKRLQKAQNQSLVSALDQFLTQWQANQTKRHVSKHTPPVSVSWSQQNWWRYPESRWQGYQKPWNDIAEKGNHSVNSETTLLSSLLDFLKQCQRQQTDDATVASQLQVANKTFQLGRWSF